MLINYVHNFPFGKVTGFQKTDHIVVICSDISRISMFMHNSIFLVLISANLWLNSLNKVFCGLGLNL